MKIYLTADIEGVAGIAHWDEADRRKPDYAQFQTLMTAEVLAACEGAMAAGAAEIWIKDAHGSGRNVLTAELPECARIIRGWSGHPLDMVQELDASFDAVLMVGYHSRAGSDDNPLAHTLTGDVREILINGVQTSEFRLHANAAAMFDVPVVFVSGDEGLCAEVGSTNDHIRTVATSIGRGPSSISIAPEKARRLIRDEIGAALGGELRACTLALADSFDVEISYREPTSAYGASFYPGASHVGPHTIGFETRDYFEVMRLIKFTT